jgi:hypothetical protein
MMPQRHGDDRLRKDYLGPRPYSLAFMTSAALIGSISSRMAECLIIPRRQVIVGDDRIAFHDGLKKWEWFKERFDAAT